MTGPDDHEQRSDDEPSRTTPDPTAMLPGGPGPAELLEGGSADPRTGRRRRRARGDRIFAGLASGSSLFVVGLVAAGRDLPAGQGHPGLVEDKVNFLISRAGTSTAPR